MRQAALVLLWCACTPEDRPPRPFTSPPFYGIGEVYSGFDLDPTPGQVARPRPGIPVWDGSDYWSWRLPEGTPLLSIGTGTVFPFLPAERNCPEGVIIVTGVHVRLDPPFQRWVYWYSGAQFSVRPGTRVRAGEPLGSAMTIGSCRGNFHLAVWDHATDPPTLVDPFGNRTRSGCRSCLGRASKPKLGGPGAPTTRLEQPSPLTSPAELPGARAGATVSALA